MSWIHAPQRREISRKNCELPLRKLVVDSASANTRKMMASGGSDSLLLLLAPQTTPPCRPCFRNPRLFSHMAALTTFLDKVHVESQTNAAMGNDDKETAAHLKALAVYVEMSSLTTMLPTGVPVDHVHDVSAQLRTHLQCVQGIMQLPRDDVSVANNRHLLLVELVEMEQKVADAIANIELGEDLNVYKKY